MNKLTIKRKLYTAIAGISMCAPAILTPIANADTLTISNQHIITGNTHLKVNNSNQDALDAIASSSSSSVSSSSSSSSQKSSNDKHKEDDSHANVNSTSSSSSSISSSSSSSSSQAPSKTTTTITTVTKTIKATSGSSNSSSSNSPSSSNKSSNSENSTHQMKLNSQPTLTIKADSPQSQKIVDYAKQIAAKQVPYVWGGTSMSGFDCSGFTQYVYREAGIGLPRTASQQASAVKRISVSDAKPGDLLFWGSRGNEYHVAIYIGGNEFIAAPEPGQTVSVQHISGYFAPSSAGTIR